jgi:predicted nucleic acid-binding protein
VWIDHLRAADPPLQRLLMAGRVLSHPFVVGEIAMGSLKRREEMLADLDCLPQAVVASDEEVRTFLDRHALFGLGIGYIDAHLLASVRLTPDARLWTRDKRLHEVAERLSVDFAESRQTDAPDGRDRRTR